MNRSLLFLCLLFVLCISVASAQTPVLSIEQDLFRLDGQDFDMWGVRVASASQSDAYKNDLISHLDEYKSYGVNTVAVFYQGSSGGSYDPFSADGKSFRSEGQRDRMDAIIEACAARDMVVVVGIFYQMGPSKGGGSPNLNDWQASQEAVRTVVRHLKSKDYRNVVLNIANEQSSGNYQGLPWERVRNTNDLIGLVALANDEWSDLIVGCGGYDDSKNDSFVASSEVDLLLFDTLDPEDSEDLYNRFVSQMTNGRKPVVNVEQFGGWTKRFNPPAGNYNAASGRSEHNKEVDRAARNAGLYTFFHSNPWFQGLSIGAPVRFDLGGSGTSSDPGVRWYFEYVAQARQEVTPPNPPSTDGYFEEQNGLLVMEAENYHEKIDRTPTNGTQQKEHAWTLEQKIDGYSGSGYMSNLPDEQCETCDEHNSPRDGSGAEMIYRVKINTAGTYEVWMRGRSLGGESNGVHIQVGDQFVEKSAGTNMSGFRPHNQWVWENQHKDYAAAPRFELSAGTHTIHIYSRDDGFRLDKILLGIGQIDAPSGQGPGESKLIADGTRPTNPEPEPTPTITFERPANGQTYGVGDNLYVVVNDASNIENMKLYLNGTFVRQENFSPWEWGAPDQNDPRLRNLVTGEYTLQVVATDTQGNETSQQISITVEGSDGGGEQTSAGIAGIYRLRHVSTGRYLDSEVGQGVSTKNANGNDDQQWRIVAVGTDLFNIDNIKDGRGVLDTQSDGNVVWAPEEAVQTDSDLVWEAEKIGSSYRFKNQASGRGYLTVKNNRAVWNNGESDAATEWLLEPVSGTTSARTTTSGTGRFVQTLEVFPNPSTGSFKIVGAVGTAEVYNLLGEKITEVVANRGVAYLQLDVRPGIYVVRSSDQRIKVLIE